MKKNGINLLIIGIIVCIVAYISVFIGRMSSVDEMLSQSHRADSAQDSIERFYFDINTATAEELMLLPGMKAQVADAIVKDRELFGHYLKVSELMNVPGMTEEIYLSILNHVYVGGTK